MHEPPSTDRRATFAEFYVAYLDQHRNPANRALHFSAKVAMLAMLIVAAVAGSWIALLAAPLLGVAPCWMGHLLFEGNQPTSWTRPSSSFLGSLRLRLLHPAKDPASTAPEGRFYWSFFADLRMCASMIGLGSAGPGVSDIERT